jgi:hypothetical protein
MKKEILLTLRIPSDLEFEIDSYCLNHGEMNRSQFIRQAIKDRLAQTPFPKITVQPKVPASTAHDTMKRQWLREAEEDRLRQIGSQER